MKYRCVAFDIDGTLLNLREAFLVARDFKSLLCVDGIHPTPEGHKLIWGAVSRLMAGAQA